MWRRLRRWPCSGSLCACVPTTPQLHDVFSDMTTRREFLTGTASVGATMAIAARIVPSGAQARFQVSDGRFVLDGQPFQVLAGEMHYPRIPRELWRDRMRKLKSLGLNTLTTYVFWNAHESKPGHFEFSGNLDVA